MYSILLLHIINAAFAKIPLGKHTILALVIVAILCFFVSVLLRQTFGTIVPLEQIIGSTLSFTFSEVCFAMFKFIPVHEKRTGKTKYYALGMYLFLRYFRAFTHSILILTGTWMHMPASHRFDLKARASVKRGIQTTYEYFHLQTRSI